MTIREKLEREQIIVALREAGATFRQLGDLFGVSSTMAFYIYRDAFPGDRE